MIGLSIAFFENAAIITISWGEIGIHFPFLFEVLKLSGAGFENFSV